MNEKEVVASNCEGVIKEAKTLIVNAISSIIWYRKIMSDLEDIKIRTNKRW